MNTEVTMPFEFINNNTPVDRASRRRIRAHAATGKNANRTLTRPSRAGAPKDHVVAPYLAPKSIRANGHESAEFEIERPIGDGLLFPMPVPATSKGLVREALFFFSGIRYSPELDSALENPGNMKSVWIRFFFLDEAYFHCSVATSILCSRNLVNETAQGMHHIARTYRIIQERLMSTEEATSDMTIAILVAMSQYERLQGEYARGHIHVQGLRRMIQLRGGLRRFDSQCCGIIGKVLRADLEYALQLGGRTLFGVEGIEFLRLLKAIGLYGSHQAPVTSRKIDTTLQKHLRADLWTIFADLKYLAVMLNDAAAGNIQKLGAENFHYTIVLLGYRLLHISPLNVETEDNNLVNMSTLEETLHLGLIAFLVTFLRGLDNRIADKPLLSRRLRIAIQKLLPSIDTGTENHIKSKALLWNLFIGVVVVFKPSDDEWLLPTTKHAMQALGLSTWEDVKQVLAEFPWVDAIHDRTGNVLCCAQNFAKLSIPNKLF